MKGALIKDLYTFKASRMWLFIGLFAGSVVGVIFTKFVPLSLPLLIFALTAPIKYAAEDKRCGWDGFAKSLPITNAEGVGARYILCFAEALVSILLMAVLEKTVQLSGVFYQSTDLIIISNTVNRFTIVCFTFAFLFITDCLAKGRTRKNISVLSCVASSIIIGFIGTIQENMGLPQLYSLEKWLLVAVACVAISIVLLSYFLVLKHKNQKTDKRSKTAIAVIGALLFLVSCSSFVVLIANKRLVHEKSTDYENFHVEGIYSPSNSQNANRAKVFETLEMLSGRSFVGEDVDIAVEMFENSEHTFLINKLLGDEKIVLDNFSQEIVKIKHSKDGKITSLKVCKDVGAGYLGENVNLEKLFSEGMSESELVSQFKKNAIPIYSMEETGTSLDDSYRIYKAVCVSFDEELRSNSVVNISIDVRDGKINAVNIARQMINTSEDQYVLQVPLDELDIYNTINDEGGIIDVAKNFCGKQMVGRDFELCYQEMTKYGFKSTDSQTYIHNGVRISIIPDITNEVVSTFMLEAENLKYIESATSETLEKMVGNFYVGMKEDMLLSELENLELYPKKITEISNQFDDTANVMREYLCSIYVNSYNDESYHYGLLKIEVQNNQVVNVTLSEE